MAAVLRMRAGDPVAFEALLARLVPERIFDPSTGDFPVLLAGRLALELREPWLEDLLVRAATGSMGGSAAQVDQALLHALLLQEDAGDALSLSLAIAESGQLPAGSYRQGLGSSVVHALLGDPQRLSEVAEADLVHALVSLLRHRLLSGSAAVHILKHVTEKPLALGEASWEQVLELARTVALDQGLQVE